MQPLRIGLVGAGPWARSVHGPGIARHPEVELAGVWARRRAAAEELAGPLGTRVFDDVDGLIDAVDAVSLCVPPAVQEEVALRAARAGRHLVLEKPIASSLPAADALARAVAAAGVASLVVLTRRFDPAVRRWLDAAAGRGWSAGTARWLSGAALGGPFSASPWRTDGGSLLDVGPHVLDLLDAALGRAEVVGARRGPEDFWQVLLGHEGGATSTATLTLRAPLDPSVVELELVGSAGRHVLPGRDVPVGQCFALLLDELVGLVRDGRTDHPCDVQRGLHVQRLLAAAQAAAQDLAG